MWEEKEERRVGQTCFFLSPSRNGAWSPALEGMSKPPQDVGVLRDTDMTQPHEQDRKLGVFTSSPPAPCPSSDQSPRQPTLPPIYLPSPSPGPLTPKRLQDYPKWPPCFQRSSSFTSSILCNAVGTVFLRANVTSLPCLQPSVAQWPQSPSFRIWLPPSPPALLHPSHLKP